MTKKKHEVKEGMNDDQAGKVADNKNVNSQDVNIPIEESGIGTDQPEHQENETITGEMTETPEGAAVKETTKEEELLVKLAEMQDKYLRLSAEFDNYRKRTLREKIELSRHAGENILKNIVPVMDDFERALKSMEASTNCTALRDGIELIYNKFRDFLGQHGIKEIDSLNAEFNVDLHEAVSKIRVEDVNLKGKVVEVLQKGYYLHDKVMRHSKVVIGE